MTYKKLIVVVFVALISCTKTDNKDVRTFYFPKQVANVNSLPEKNRFWIFFLAGQSNMAGRGRVEPEDTIPSNRVLVLNKNEEWVLAKEPLHYYEPNLTGLDCGLSFGKALVDLVGDSISIGLIPCAVGGSSSSQWLDDSIHRNVKLYSNFEDKVRQASKVGVIKGIIWHQGEADANETKLKDYQARITNLLGKFRLTVQNDSLPICIGELGSFVNEKYKNSYPDSVNQILNRLAETQPNTSIVGTSDLIHKGDTIHFNSSSQRVLGKRFASEIFKLF